MRVGVEKLAVELHRVRAKLRDSFAGFDVVHENVRTNANPILDNLMLEVAVADRE